MFAARRRWARFALVVALLLTLTGVLAGSAWAAEFRAGDTVIIGAGEVIDDDLFISANTVVVDGTVNGDLLIAGAQARVNGTVNGSLLFAGQSLVLDGRVTGTLYGAGASVTLGPQASLGRNVFFAGYSLRAEPGSTVGRDLAVSGNQALLDGQVERHVRFGGNALVVNGSVGGDVQATVAEPGPPGPVPPFAGPGLPPPAPAGLRVGPAARIGGRLIYRSPVEQTENIQAQPGGGVVFERAPERVGRPVGAAAWALSWLRGFVTLLALGALAIWGLGAPFTALADKVWNRPLPSLGWGALIIVAGYAAAAVAIILILIVTALLAILTLGRLAGVVFAGAGAAWAFGFAIFHLAVAYGSALVIAYLLGKIVLQRLAGQPGERRIWLLLVGVAIFSLLRSIPFFGAVVGLAAAPIGLGAIYLVWRDSQARPTRAAGE